MGLTVEHNEGKEAMVASLEEFVVACLDTNEWDLLGPSRCHGWSRLDVVVHVLAGWQELLGGLVSPVTGPHTVDAATYWSSFADDAAGHDPIDRLMAQRRRTDAYRRPASALTQLTDVADHVRRGAESFAEGHYTFQGYVFRSGDLLASWAVENAVHLLDLHRAAVPPPRALRLARLTAEALLGQSLPNDWSDEQAVLVATGRLPPTGHVDLTDRLPVFG